MDRAHNKKINRILGFASLILTVVCAVSVIAAVGLSRGSLEICLPEGTSGLDFAAESGKVDILTDPVDSRRITVTAKGTGEEYLVNNADGDQEIGFIRLTIMRGGMIYESQSGNFSGYRPVAVIMWIYLLLVTVCFVVSFILRCRTQFYSYTTIYYAGAAVFLINLLLRMTDCALVLFHDPDMFRMIDVYSALKNSGTAFMLLTLPLAVIFVLSLAFSNISLIRHEGVSFVNVLGFLLCGVMAAIYLIQFFYVGRFVTGSEQEVRIITAADSIFTTVFVYFEAMLAATILCGVISVKKRPALDKTHIIILGCAVAKDGTPLPLLRGRIDRAIRFAEEQEAAGGAAPRFVPSGGRGADEVISEAECMKNYLISQGIAEERIIPEDKSTSTEENMRFSRQIIEADCPEPRIVFSTSNYHVLRSGMISRSEGLDAEGIGCRTKWYFWPNAFVREFIGLLAEKWKQHLFWMAFFSLLLAVTIMIAPL